MADASLTSPPGVVHDRVSEGFGRRLGQLEDGAELLSENRPPGQQSVATSLASRTAAAATMTASSGAMQLRTLQTIDGLGPIASNTVVLAVPIEIMELVKRFGGQPAP
jgi:hypothetical protein